MPPTVRRDARAAAGLLAAAALAASGLAVGGLTAPATSDPGGGSGRGHHPQTSDGVRGPVAAYVPPVRRTAPVISNEVTWSVARGVTFRRWDQTDARGPVHLSLLDIDPSVKGVRLDYAARPRLRERTTVRRFVLQEPAVGGVNGNFFDIGDTDAPIGTGVDRERGLLHAPLHGWNSTFALYADGSMKIRQLPLVARLVDHPRMRVTNLNSPSVTPEGIGIYTRAWGRTAGYRVVNGATHVREVVVRHGRVRANRPRLTHGHDIRGLLLVGRGTGADRLSTLEVGSRLRATWHLRTSPAVALTGSEVLLKGGTVRASDDTEMHPRTALGIDRGNGHVLLLVVDGRQDSSRGYTLVELATELKALGAEAGLNLDGGGSSTMAARARDGVVRVLNSPSAGTQRRVPDALVVRGTVPAG